MTITGSTFSNNTASSTGGGIYNEGGSLTISSSTFSSNSAFLGGGVFDDAAGETDIDTSTFASNVGTYQGGGIYHGTGGLHVTYSTIANNTAGYGGGVWTNPSEAGQYVIAWQTTVAFNKATASGDTCGDGGGVYGNNSAFLDWNGSIIAGNTDGSGALDDFVGTIHALQTEWSDGLNPSFLSHYFCKPSGWQVTSTEPSPAFSAKLKDNVYTVAQLFGTNKLNSNGGPTQTVLLSSTSPAINATQNPFKNTFMGFNPTDQRGDPAPLGKVYDLGSVEVIEVR